MRDGYSTENSEEPTFSVWQPSPHPYMLSVLPVSRRRKEVPVGRSSQQFAGRFTATWPLPARRWQHAKYVPPSDGEREKRAQLLAQVFPTACSESRRLLSNQLKDEFPLSTRVYHSRRRSGKEQPLS